MYCVNSFNHAPLSLFFIYITHSFLFTSFPHKMASPDSSMAIVTDPLASMNTSEPETNDVGDAAAALFAKEHVEKFLADAWNNLMMRDNRCEETEEDVNNVSFESPPPLPSRSKAKKPRSSRKGKAVASSANGEEAEQTPRRRGRPVSSLDWLPHGWIRITKPRENGQIDTFYRQIDTNRMLRSSYDVLCFTEFGKVIKKDKERIKQILEAKYVLKFPKEKRRRSAPPALEGPSAVNPAGADLPPSGDQSMVLALPAAAHGSPAKDAAEDGELEKKEDEAGKDEEPSDAVDMVE